LARLQQLEIGTLADRFPDQVSGGEQQRAGIARALVIHPELVLADEPTGSLDAQNADRVLDALFSLTRQESKSVVVATHSAAVAARADRILTVVDGSIAEGSTVSDLAW
ncbi:MAG: ATP-binding cassette domain-containing protein, partial [Pseudomonadota bacterium]